MRTGWKVYIDSQPERRVRRLHLHHEGADGSISIATSLNMEKVKRHGTLPECGGVLGVSGYEETDDFLRAIMDAAWEFGIRPTGFSDHTNELTAVRYHLEDMRTLAKVK